MGLVENLKNRLGRPRHAPKRESFRYPSLVSVGRANQLNKIVYKASPRNLRYFSRTPMARRAINAIKNPIKMLAWEVCPLDGLDWNSELKRQAGIATFCLDHPNEIDDFQSLSEQLIEDFCIGAAAAETEVGGDKNRPLWIWPLDGLSIQMNPTWTGKPGETHYYQTLGYGSIYGGGKTIALSDDQVMYIRPNPSTETPFGYGAMEIAFNSIARLLGVAEFAGNLATNSLPSIAIDMPGATPDDLQQMRKYFINEVEGQGRVPIFASETSMDGKGTGIKAVRLYPEGDGALYLQYQDILVRELGAAFDLSPQNFGLERDVNRNTSEVAEDRDWRQAIIPAANDIAKNLTRHCIQKSMGFSQLRFKYIGLDREDEVATMQVLEKRYKTNSVTPNEIRDRFGEAPDVESQWGDMVLADVEVAKEAARSAAEVIDSDLEKVKSRKPSPNKKTTN
jgi:Phage portal protein